MMFIPREEVEWKLVKYLKEPLSASPQHATWKYEFILPEPLASWDVFDYWEKERIQSMEENLKKGDVLFDVGTEQGWCNLAYANIVGPENVVLIEPTQEFWPNIKETWRKNFPNVNPRACVPVLLSDKNTHDYDYRDFVDGWPKCSDDDLIDRNKYQYIHDNSENIPEVTIDHYVNSSGIVPDALTMDVEGAELLILKGAKSTLKKYKPKLFISIHPYLGERDYGVKKEDTVEFLEQLGYISKYLATDHEEHYFFECDK
jgi:FkbM family methyltransferase